MADFTIVAVSDEVEDWSNDHGAFKTYQIEATGNQGQGFFRLNQKASTEPPQAGQTIDAEIVQKQGKPYLKRVQQNPQQNPQQGSFTAPKGGYGKTPGESNRISRMNSHARANELLKLQIESGAVDPKGKTFSELVLPLAEAYYRDALKAGEE